MKIKLPFEPSTPAQYAGIGAMDDESHIINTITNNEVGMKYLIDNFKRMNIEYIKSVTNFITILLDSEESATNLFDYMLDRGIILRHLINFGIPHAIRITIGTKDENMILVKELEKRINDDIYNR